MIIKNAVGAMEWRQGRFPRLELGKQYYHVMPEEYYGKIIGRPRGLPAHIKGAYEGGPEGIALIAVCVCGGRHEALIDVRETRYGPEFEKAIPEGVEAAERALQRFWIPEHRNCHSAPKQHHIPDLVQEFVGAVEGAARNAIAAGRGTPSAIYILDARGRAFWTPFDGDNAVVYHFAVREEMRAQKLDVLAVVVVDDIWGGEERVAYVPIDDTNDTLLPQVATSTSIRLIDPGLSIVYATRTFGRYGQASVTRKGTRGYYSPGQVGPITWNNLDDGCWYIDSLLA